MIFQYDGLVEPLFFGVTPELPAYIERPTLKHRSKYNFIALPEHNIFPATPADYYTGYYPGSGLAVSNRVIDKRKLQSVPELNTYPATPAPDQPLTGWTVHFEPTKNATNRKLLSVLEHNQYPVFAPFPAYLERPVFKHRSRYKALAVPEHNTFPATPAGFYSGYFPGSGLAKSIKSSFKLKHRTVPELNVYPSTPVTTEPVVSWIDHFEQIKNATHRRLLHVDHNRYPVSPAVPSGPNFGVSAILNAGAFGIRGSMDSDAFGVVGALDADSFGAPCILNDGSYGVKGSMDSDAFGVIGSLGE